ncbi:TPA: YqcC family protein [Stenotrophomonas maltophilia]|uniref:YqcC family protein n=1 Tax=Stenotrophomonas sp. TaxID=69392 RepID=UPI0028A8F103|nr:YqcC family protein [Stenotrophomonas sp.]HDS0950967.1 YqcC family protein [Stenotrophomonas maltophilia]HDS1027299.1 YqcC family protein [Stenotrophomonas maltophilia]HDS1031237.1 YqcC family protein [Stenotrophomonas maltophilia]HDS1036099.1 YqcC family protein [Stenotrophomonas maltophilia]
MRWLDALRRPRAEDPRAALVAPIEQALRALGWVEGEVGAPRAVDSPFGIDEMPFEHWLAQVFLPRLYEARADGQWPPRSDVAVAAWRNLEGQPGVEPLLQLLSRLDATINTGVR